MSSPLQREVLTPKKPIWVYRLEQKIEKQERRIKLLEDTLEETSIQNKKLKLMLNSASIPIDNMGSVSGKTKTGSPQFKMSL